MPRLKTPRLVTGTRIAVASEIYFHTNYPKLGCPLGKESFISWRLSENFEVSKLDQARGKCYPRSRLKTRHFEKPRFPSFELQKLD